MSSLFGGSSSKNQSVSTASSQGVNDSHTWNNAYPSLVNQFGSTADNTAGASNAMANLLGLGTDPSAQSAAFDNYKNSTGYQFKMDQGVDAITGSNAAKGLLNSGATLKGINTFGQGLAGTTFNDYMSQLLGLGNQGISAGSLISGAGQESLSHGENSSMSQSQSTGKGSSKPGIGGLLGSLMSGAAKG